MFNVCLPTTCFSYLSTAHKHLRIRIALLRKEMAIRILIFLSKKSIFFIISSFSKINYRLKEPYFLIESTYDAITNNLSFDWHEARTEMTKKQRLKSLICSYLN